MDNRCLLKKIVTGSVVALSVFAAGHFTSPAEAAPAPSIIVNGSKIETDVPPVIQNGRTLVPIRFVSSALGASVEWTQANQTATVQLGQNNLAFPYGRQVYYLNGQAKGIDVNIQLINNRIMIPLRVAGESLGQNIWWDNATRTVTVTSPTPAPPEAAAQEAKTPAGSGVSGVVTVTHAPGLIFKEASTNSEVLAQADKDVRYDAVDKVGEFYQIVLPDGQKAWISEILVQFEAYGKPQPSSPSTPSTPTPPNPTQSTSAASSAYLEVTGSVVNIRSGSSTDYPVIDTVKQGDVLTRLSSASGWHQVQLANGKKGWITGAYVKGTTSRPQTPAAAPSSAPAQSTGQNQKDPITVKRVTPGLGQYEVTFKVGQGQVDVLKNNGNQLKVAIRGVSANPQITNPVAGKAPFQSFQQTTGSNNEVIIATTVESGGYFRLDRRGDEFSIMAVRKHKNGQLGLVGKTIVVSPGHGEYTSGTRVDPGAIGSVLGLSEVAFNTPVALKLKQKLEAAGAKVIMIREKAPVRISLAGRAMVANDNNADAYVEIHGDAAPGNPNAVGIGVYIYDGNLRLTSAAQKDMRQEFAKIMQTSMNAATGTRTYTRTGNFAVLRENEVPSVLIECGFLTTAFDEARLATDSYQNQLAQGMYDGLVKYFSY
ncbi:N-acetylmuramoyl-L-alanine amidase [Peptococcus simiae]|uniref:N-acetylmuramoyl-L-alanine amidase n=1 Tax=Peptococcus simiae TaxID=1643805 RepID=A0ABW9GYS2_9FIRM